MDAIMDGNFLELTGARDMDKICQRSASSRELHHILPHRNGCATAARCENTSNIATRDTGNLNGVAEEPCGAKLFEGVVKPRPLPDCGQASCPSRALQGDSSAGTETFVAMGRLIAMLPQTGAL